MILFKSNCIHQILGTSIIWNFKFKKKIETVKLNTTSQCELKAHTEFNPECRLLWFSFHPVAKTLHVGRLAIWNCPWWWTGIQSGANLPAPNPPQSHNAQVKVVTQDERMKLYFRFGQNRTKPLNYTVVLCSTCFVVIYRLEFSIYTEKISQQAQWNIWH